MMNPFNNFLRIKTLKKKIPDEANFCEQPITEKDILSSLKNLHNQKIPGTDGLPADFYNFFWIEIKNILTDSNLYAVNPGELSIEQRD